MEQRGRGDVRLPRRGDDRPADLPAAAAGSHRRRGDDPRAAEPRRAAAALRDDPGTQGWPRDRRVADHFADSGRVRCIIGASKIIRDITAERHSQSRIQELQAELVHVARLSTMGQMASAIAHELNQPLTAVGNYAGALGRVLADTNAGPDRARDIVERIRQQTTRAGEVIRRLRDHVAKRRTTRRLEDVNAVVERGSGTRAGRHAESRRAGIGRAGSDCRFRQ